MLIAITGTIASGATTLARLIADEIQAEPMLEADVETDNPFFSMVHNDPARYSFHNQMYFLTKSAERHRNLRTRMVANAVYIEDFTPFEHTEVYAKVQYELGRLTRDEYHFLQRATNLIQEFFIVPSIIVYREQNPERIFARIRDRGRPSEQKSDIEYLQALNTAFDDWISGWERCPVIRVQPETDVLADPQFITKITCEIRASQNE